MKSFNNFLLEKSQSVLETLGKYDKPNTFVSFTNDLKSKGEEHSQKKLGINPTNNYNTPTGIYSYPIKEMLPTFATETMFATGRPIV